MKLSVGATFLLSCSRFRLTLRGGNPARCPGAAITGARQERENFSKNSTRRWRPYLSKHGRISIGATKCFLSALMPADAAARNGRARLNGCSDGRYRTGKSSALNRTSTRRHCLPLSIEPRCEDMRRSFELACGLRDFRSRSDLERDLNLIADGEP